MKRIALALLPAVAVVGLTAVPAQAETAVSVTDLTTTLPYVSPWQQVTGGSTFDLTVRLSGPAPAGGAVVKVAKGALTPGPVYTLDTPLRLTVPAGASSVTVQVPTLPTSSLIVEQLIASADFTATTSGGFAGLGVAVAPRPASDPRGLPSRVEAESGALSGAATVQTTTIGGSYGSATTTYRSVAFTGQGASARYTVNATVAGDRLMVLNVATPRGTRPRSDVPPQLTVTVNGTARSVTVRLTPGATSYAWVPVPVTLAAGSNTITVSSADGRSVNLDWFELSR